MQIYFDFSGYSDMAIGLGKMLGFEFVRNFDYPYISKKHYGLLEKMAYFSQHLVPRVCIYPVGRQQSLQSKACA